MKSILLVDDDPLVRRSIFRMLRVHGFHVVQAGSGEQALHLLEQLGGEHAFDAILSDYNLGDGMDGDHLMACIAESYPKLTRFGMSGYIENWDEALGVGRVLDAWEKMDAARKLVAIMEV